MREFSDLMTTRLCDLRVNLKKSHLWWFVLQLYDELKARGIRFRPSCYFADEWFVPEGDPVIGIPFYLATKPLMRLEKKMIGEVEGESPSYFMKLLRHEAGHALSYAYKLHKETGYKRLFGHSSTLFSDLYKFNRKSKQYVLHLKDHYAQSHPDEDFAESFAVWLTYPERVWRKKYHGWKAFKKLEYVHHLMKEIRGCPPLVKEGEKMCRVSKLKYTLWTYYMRRRALLEHHRKRP